MMRPDIPKPRIRHALVYSAQMEPVGGIESHVVEFCLQLASAGYRITLMSSRFALAAGATAQLRSAGIQLLVNHRSWSSSSAARKWLWTLLALLRLSNRRFDVVYTNGQGRNSATVQAWYRNRVRTVHHHHTSCDPADAATWPAAYLDAMRKADVLVVCADFIRGRMRRTTGRQNVDVVYCFSRQLALTPTRAAPASRCVFGYFGRLIREKGIDTILRLSEDPRLQGITWKIWGNEATYRARDFAGRRNVEYQGEFSDSQGLQAVLEALDCFCLFSTHPEGIPISLIEVMAVGKPWIATPQGGIPELVHDPESCVLVPTDDYEGAVNACVTMCARLQSGSIDRARQQAFYRKRFASNVLLSQWMRLLDGGIPVTP
jgi:glycosyltransferase involved in cell wall biosynthesis